MPLKNFALGKVLLVIWGKGWYTATDKFNNGRCYFYCNAAGTPLRRKEKFHGKKTAFFAPFSCRALLLVTVLCACGDESQSEVGGTGSDGTSTSGEAVTGGELVVGISQDLGDSLDPYQMTAAGTREVLFNVYEGLVKPTSTGEYVPAVASDSTVSEDGLTYTFPLREGVLFHNGEEVTTDDVIYSFETCAETTVDTALAAALSAVESVTADGNTITVTLSEANPDFLSYVGMVYIVPDDYTDQATAPVGTGPFRFVSRSVQQNLVMEKFADYWGEGASLDKVTFQIFEDSNALMSALSAESVDMAVHLTIDQVNTIGEGTYKTLEGTMNLVQALYLNNNVEPFNNEQVRQALCYAIDVDEIMELTAEGHGTKVGTSIYPAFTKYYDESLNDAYPYDTENGQGAAHPGGLSRRVLHDHHRPLQLSAPHRHGHCAGGAAEGRGHHRGDSACGVGCLAQRGVRKPAVPVHRGRRRRLQHDCPGAAGAVHLCGGRQLYQLSEHGL